jgi:hypothetical protein
MYQFLNRLKVSIILTAMMKRFCRNSKNQTLSGKLGTTFFLHISTIKFGFFHVFSITEYLIIK